MSKILVIALLAFVGIASGALLWEGLALAAQRHGGTGREGRHPRAMLAVGVIGVAIVLWIAFGILTHAW